MAVAVGAVATPTTADAFVGDFVGTHEAAAWALHWCADDSELITESYVNLVPTVQGGCGRHWWLKTSNYRAELSIRDHVNSCCERSDEFAIPNSSMI